LNKNHWQAAVERYPGAFFCFVYPLQGDLTCVTNSNLLGPNIRDQVMSPKWKGKAALTMTELLCVIAVILILSSLYLPAIARAYTKIRKFLGKM
jgi:prepilin-type N-terminal cleavage/methylation domain-containing protein